MFGIAKIIKKWGEIKLSETYIAKPIDSLIIEELREAVEKYRKAYDGKFTFREASSAIQDLQL